MSGWVLSSSERRVVTVAVLQQYRRREAEKECKSTDPSRRGIARYFPSDVITGAHETVEEAGSPSSAEAL